MRHCLKNILSAGILMCMVAACEDLKFGDAFLDKPLSVEINIDTIFSSKIHSEQALNQFYKSLPDFMPTASSGCRPEGRVLDLYSDLGYNDGIPWRNGVVNASMGKGALPYNLFANSEIMGDPFFGIRKAYIYLENIDRVPDMTEEEKNIRKAEAKVVIATHYIQMIRFLGGVPWIDHAYKPDETFLFPRMTLEETVLKTVALLDEAAAILPWYTTEEEYGHMTAAAAKALKLRLLLFVASPLFNADKPYFEGQAADERLTWYGGYSEQRWRDALDAGLEFLRLNKQNSNYYQMENTGNPRADFRTGYFVKGNREVVMPTFRDGTWNGSRKFFRIYGQRNKPRASYANMFQWIDGTDFSWEQVNDPDPNNEHYNQPFFDKDGKPVRDIRLYETLMVNGDSWTPPENLQMWNGGKHGPTKYDQRTLYGYGYRKFIQDYNSGGTMVYGYPYSCPWIRMPEIYLSVAEAMNQLGIATQKDEFECTAYDYLNMIRRRAGITKNVTAEMVTVGTELTEFLLDERAREFGQEDCRYYDMVRYKKGNDWVTIPLEKLLITGNKNKQNYTTEISSDEFYYWKEYWYLFPFPVTEINKRYGLIQNPGY